MKITQYQQMMAYLMRPKFNGGGPVGGNFVKPKKKPEKEVKKRKKENFEKAKDALENPDEVKEMMDLADGGRIGFKTAGLVTNLLSKIPVRTGAERVEKITDFTAQKDFMDAFLEFMNKKHDGNFSAAARAIGQDRNKIKGIFDRVRLSKTGTRAGADIGKGTKLQTTIPEPKNKLLYKDATTAVKADQKFFKDKIKNYNKTKYYNAKDLGNILGVDVSNKSVLDKLTADLKRFNVKLKSATGVEGGKKTYQLDDVVNKLTKGYKKKLVEGQRKSKTKRLEQELRLDPDLKVFLGNFKQTTRNISKEEGIYVKNAIEDVGHPLSIEITDKYPKLTKNSNINKIDTLTFQDPLINKGVLQKTGYESKHDALFETLNKLVNKKVGPKEIEKLKLVKSQMNALHDKVLTDVKKLAQENIYLKGQENRIPKIDIKLPKEGQIFKSEDLFIDMSKVNSAFKVGLVDQIKPNARFFKDLNTEQKEIYKRNVLDQTKFNLDKFYTKSGFPKEQVEELKDSLEFGTSSKLGIGTVGTLGLGSTAAAAGETGAETLESFPTKTAAGATLAAGAVGTKTGRNILGKAFKALPTLGGGLALNLAFQPDLSSGVDRAALGAEAAFAPQLVQQASKLGPTGQRIANLLMSPKMAMRAARIASPIGIATLAGEGLYQAGKYAIDRRKELQSMSPVERDRLRQESDAFSFNEFSAAGGGIAKLAGKSSGRPPESGPTPQGLDFLIKRGRQS